MLSKVEFETAMGAIEKAWDAWNKSADLLGLQLYDDAITSLIDEYANTLSIAMGDNGLPFKLDGAAVMRVCGNDLPLVHWFCWELDFGRAPKTIQIGGEYEVEVKTAGDLYEAILKVKELS